MPRCIFCETETEHEVARGRSLCLECLVEIRRFEMQNAKAIKARVLAPEVNLAHERVLAYDPATASPTETHQFYEDIDLLKKVGR